MPYLEQHRKAALALGVLPETPGDLNYLLTHAALDYSRDRNMHQFEYKMGQYVGQFIEANGGESYTNYNNAIGAMLCCKMEWERRAPETVLRQAASAWERYTLERDVLTEVSSTLDICIRALYEHRIAPYEDTKIEQNGDVYP